MSIIKQENLANLNVNIGPVSGSWYMARLHTTRADWGLDKRIRCGFDKHLSKCT